MSQKPSTANAAQTWNVRITRYFLENVRLTVLLFFFIITLGIASVMLMRTTGFPSPEIKLVLVQTPYLGASAETVSKEVTVPIEGALKSIEGIESFSSQSANSFSVVSIDIKEEADSNDVRSKIDAAIRTIDLPEGADAPTVTVPSFAGPDVILSVVGKDLATAKVTADALTDALTALPDTSSVKELYPVQKQVEVRLDADALKDKGLAINDVQSQLASVSEVIPAVSNVTVSDKNQNILTVASETSIDTLKSLVVRAEGTTTVQTPRGPQTVPVSKVVLDDIADINTVVAFEEQTPSIVSYAQGNEAKTQVAITLLVDGAEGIRLKAYTDKVSEEIRNLENVQFVAVDGVVAEDTNLENTTLVLEQYTGSEFNDRQVDEVIEGLVGGTLPIDSPLKHLGWLLGGIQLVFLVMIAFVSWRAAIVAALSIPLSLVFSTIYLYVIGEDLNTLVLFSLVLVIGLVVDPALVILESIQRKLDAGHKGAQAALEAVKDIGSGLFLATLTNIIVFLPFGLISGFLGEVFAYIPLTIIPAVIGSYVVPLIFLAWVGGLFLKKQKGTGDSEEENMFLPGKWVMRLNEYILETHPVARIAIIIMTLFIPLGVAGWMFGSGMISVVQFSSASDSDYVTVAVTQYPGITQDEAEKRLTTLLQTVQSNPNVQYTLPLDGAGTYYARLAPKKDRENQEVAKDIAADIDAAVAGQKKDFFDMQVRVDSVGPPSGTYQVALAVKSEDDAKRKEASIAIAGMLEHVCDTNGVFTISEECAGGKHIVIATDDSYTGKLTSSIEVKLDREKIQQKQLSVQQAPLGLLVNSALKNAFKPNDGKKVTKVTEAGESIDVVLATDADVPDTLDEIRDAIIIDAAGVTVRVKDVATVEEVEGSSAIRRVKGETLDVVQARLADGYTDQARAAAVSTAILNELRANDAEKLAAYNMEADDVEVYSEGSTASATRSFQDLSITLVLAIMISYIVLAVFFNSFTLPLVILYTIPLTFLGIFPGLALFSTAEFGFLEIIGMIILVGLVENVAIFLIDAARHKINDDGWSEKRAIAYASGVRLRPVLMTKFTATASLLPLAILSETYRPISVVIICGLLTSGFTSLVTTPILYIFFRFVSRHFWAAGFWGRVLWLFFWPVMACIAAVRERKK